MENGLSGTPPTAAPPQRSSSLRSALNRHPLVTGTLAVLVIVGTGALIYWESRSDEVGPRPEDFRDRGREVRAAPASQPATTQADDDR